MPNKPCLAMFLHAILALTGASAGLACQLAIPVALRSLAAELGLRARLGLLGLGFLQLP